MTAEQSLTAARSLQPSSATSHLRCPLRRPAVSAGRCLLSADHCERDTAHCIPAGCKLAALRRPQSPSSGHARLPCETS